MNTTNDAEQQNIDLTKPIDTDNPQPFWRGSFIFEVDGGRVGYVNSDRPSKPLTGYPNHMTISMSKKKALETIEILSRQLQDKDLEDCSIWFPGELILDTEEDEEEQP